MNSIAKDSPKGMVLLMGNEAIARGAIEANVRFCSAYPGTPSSEIIGSLSSVAKNLNLYVEWSVNEKVALEAAAAASFAGLRAISAMKPNGLNVASDFLLNLNLSGCKGGLVIVVCDDPAAWSSSSEEDSRIYAKLADLPLIEPSTFQEAKEMTRWAFELSEEFGIPCIIRSVTRISHARGNVELGEIPKEYPQPYFDPSRMWITLPVSATHQALHRKIAACQEKFETSPFNIYRGADDPELLIITSGTGWMYVNETVSHLKLEDRCGILRLATTWPQPEKFLLEHTKKVDRILFVEEVDPFLENNVKELVAQHAPEIGCKTFYGKVSGHLPDHGEMNPDLVLGAIKSLMQVQYEPRTEAYVQQAREATRLYAPIRELGFCAGCPHRATFWSIKNALKLDGREGFVLGDIGCYTMGIMPTGFFQSKTFHAMGSGAGLANGLGRLAQFGFKQPVVAVCGDSTFYHAVIPALINARYNGSNFVMCILDNSGTAMTGFQPHPGTGLTAMGEPACVVDIEALCQAIGAKVEVVDPFDIKETTERIYSILQDEEGIRILILRRECALLREKRGGKLYRMSVEKDFCIGDLCGCNRLCVRVFKCPGLMWDRASGKADIDEVICTGCGVCADICPQGAIKREFNDAELPA
jgi:indolepyruvate ferredoxin oxidoreductase alpha subunit